MSNVKLKQQIEAAKIALVHSAEASASSDMSRASDTVTQTPSISENSAQRQDHRPADILHEPTHPNVELSGRELGFHEMAPQSDYEQLEARLQGLEDQIKNQQRDLHTLLQKLREITSKSQVAAKVKKSSGSKKWLVGGLLCALGLCVVFYGVSIEKIIAAFYHVTGLAVGLIDTLASKI